MRVQIALGLVAALVFAPLLLQREMLIIGNVTPIIYLHW